MVRIGRAPTNLQASLIQQNLLRTQLQLIEAQKKMSTLRNIQTPSDDPAVADRVLKYENMIEQGRQFQRNTETGTRFLSVSEDALASVSEIAIQAKAILLREATDTSTAATRSASAIEIQGLLSEALRLANTKLGNRSVFAGSRTELQAFVQTNNGILYQGDEHDLLTSISPSAVSPYNTTGKTAFGALTTEVKGDRDLKPLITYGGRVGKSTDTWDNYLVSDEIIGNNPDFMVGQSITFTSGANNGTTRTITDYKPDSGLIYFDQPLPNEYAKGDTFEITGAFTPFSASVSYDAGQTLLDSSLDGKGENLFNRLYLSIATGSDKGQIRQVQDFRSQGGVIVLDSSLSQGQDLQTNYSIHGVSTPLADLLKGKGPTSGKFRIDDGVGHSLDVDLSKLSTVKDLIDFINADPNLGVKASISEDGKSIEIGNTRPIEFNVDGTTGDIIFHGTTPTQAVALILDDAQDIGILSQPVITGDQFEYTVNLPFTGSTVVTFSNTGVNTEEELIQLWAQSLINGGAEATDLGDDVQVSFADMDVFFDVQPGESSSTVLSEFYASMFFAGKVDIIPDIVSGAISVQLSDGSLVTAQPDSTPADPFQFALDFLNQFLTSGVGSIETSAEQTQVLITDIENGSAAKKLGLTTTTSDGRAVSVDLDPKLTNMTAIGLLNEGNGVSRDGIRILNGSQETLISFQDSFYVQDVLNKLNSNEAGLLAKINVDSRTMDVQSRLSANRFFLQELGGSSAEDFGLHTDFGEIPLANINNGRGIGTSIGNDFQITLHDGTVLDVNLSGAKTMQDVVNMIESAVGNNGKLDADIVASTLSVTDGNLKGELSFANTDMPSAAERIFEDLRDLNLMDSAQSGSNFVFEFDLPLTGESTLAFTNTGETNLQGLYSRLGEALSETGVRYTDFGNGDIEIDFYGMKATLDVPDTTTAQAVVAEIASQLALANKVTASTSGTTGTATLSDGSQLIFESEQNIGSAAQFALDLLNQFFIPGAPNTSRINPNGIELKLRDNTPGAGAFGVTRLGDSNAAIDLNIDQTAGNADIIKSGDLRFVGFQGDNLFTALQTLFNALGANDRDGILLAGDILERATNTVLDGRTVTGTRLQRFEATRSQMEDQEVSLTGLVSKDRDADLAETVLEFQTLQTLLQSGLASSAQILNVSLLDFI